MNNFDKASIQLNLSRIGVEITNCLLEQIFKYSVGKKICYFHSSEISLFETPYSAFRKRNDKIITRRYRKFDKQNYEKLDQFKNSFESFSRITELIHYREVLKNKLVLLLQAAFFQRNNDQSWVGMCNIDFHTDTYFLTTVPSYENDHMMDKQQIYAIDTMQSTNNLNAISSNNSKYFEECIAGDCSSISAKKVCYQGSRDHSYLSTIDGKFSFVPNTSSRYIQASTESLLLMNLISSSPTNHLNRSFQRICPTSSIKMYNKYPFRDSITRPRKKPIEVIISSSDTHFHISNSMFQLD